MTAIPLLARDGSIRAVAIIDTADWARAKFHTWWFDGQYAATRIGGRRGPKVYLHRFLMGDPPQPGLEIDHRDQNKLNNRRRNLRWVTHRTNCANVPAQSGTSIYRGVSWDAARGLWRAQAGQRPSDGSARMRFLGRFAREEDAAEAVRRFWAAIEEEACMSTDPQSPAWAKDGRP